MCIGVTDDVTNGKPLTTYPNKTDHTLVGFMGTNCRDSFKPGFEHVLKTIRLQDLAGIRLMKIARAPKLQVF